MSKKGNQTKSPPLYMKFQVKQKERSTSVANFRILINDQVSPKEIPVLNKSCISFKDASSCTLTEEDSVKLKGID